MKEEVGRFPRKGKTMVGEKGIMLSGGQAENQSGKSYAETLQSVDIG